MSFLIPLASSLFAVALYQMYLMYKRRRLERATWEIDGCNSMIATMYGSDTDGSGMLSRFAEAEKVGRWAGNAFLMGAFSYYIFIGIEAPDNFWKFRDEVRARVKELQKEKST